MPAQQAGHAAHDQPLSFQYNNMTARALHGMPSPFASMAAHWAPWYRTHAPAGCAPPCAAQACPHQPAARGRPSLARLTSMPACSAAHTSLPCAPL
eukprot:291161-Chlamydomonas_euryale.AAC.2